MPEIVIPSAAVDALAEELYYDEDSDDSDVKWEDYRPDAEKTLRQVVPHLVEHIAQRIEAVDPVEWALAGQRAGRDAARIVRGAFREKPDGPA